VDTARKRIALSLREHPESAPARRPQRDGAAAEKTQGKPKPVGQRKEDTAGHRPFQGLLPKPGK
jgi:transcriptional accessory protein Tex/SPT6